MIKMSSGGSEAFDARQHVKTKATGGRALCYERFSLQKRFEQRISFFRRALSPSPSLADLNVRFV